MKRFARQVQILSNSNAPPASKLALLREFESFVSGLNGNVSADELKDFSYLFDSLSKNETFKATSLGVFSTFTVDNVASMDAQTLVVVASAFARLSSCSDAALSAISCRAQQLIPFAPGMVACALANSLARLNLDRTSSVYTITRDRINFTMNTLFPTDLATGLYALDKMGFLDFPTLRASACRLRDTSDCIQPSSCAILLRIFSHSPGCCPPELIEVIIRTMLTSEADNLRVHDLTLTLNAMARLRLRNGKLWEALTPRLHAEVYKMEPRNVANVLHAMARMDLRNDELMERLISHTLQTRQNFSFPELSVTIYALAVCGVREPRTYGQLYAVLSHSDFHPFGVSQLLHAMAILHKELPPHPIALRLLLDYVQTDLKAFDAVAATRLLQSLDRLHCPSSIPPVLDHLASLVLTSQQAAVVLRARARLR